MTELHIVGWREGLQKISMTRLLKEQAGLRLSEAKSCTDRVLENELVIIQILDADNARKLAEQLEHMGAIVKIKTVKN